MRRRTKKVTCRRTAACRSSAEAGGVSQSGMARLKGDPVSFAREALGVKPWRRQEEILRLVAEKPRVAVAGGHAVGKDYVAAVAMLWFLHTRPGSIVLSTAPTWRQVKHLLWRELRHLHARARMRLGGTLLETELKLGPRWYALGFSTDEADRFQGFHAPSMLVVIDEAAGVAREIHEAADGVLSGQDAHLLLIGNPTSRGGRFHKAFSDPTFVTLRIPCFEHPNVQRGPLDEKGSPPISGAVTREWIEMVRASYGEESAYFQSRVLALFPTADADALLEPEWIERARAAAPRSGQEGTPGRRTLGADIARFGNDSTVICVAEGGTLIELVSFRKLDLVRVADEIERRIRRHDVDPARCSLDDTGLGGGVTDILRSRGLAVRGVQFGARARRHDRFANISSEMFWNLRRLFEAGGVALGGLAGTRDAEMLAEQLGLLAVQYTSDGRIRVTGDPGHLAAPSTSPDHADALGLCLSLLPSGEP